MIPTDSVYQTLEDAQSTQIPKLLNVKIRKCKIEFNYNMKE